MNRAPQPFRVERFVRWVRRGAIPTMPLIFVASVFALLGFGFVPTDVSDRNEAREVAAHGVQVTVTDPEVHVGKFQGRGGDYYEADAVRVPLPGLRDKVELTGLPESDEFDSRPMRLGWQPPTARTGYQAPLDVTYLHQSDGTVRAMADRDMHRLANSREPEKGLLIGFGMLALITLGIAAGNNNALRRLIGIKDSGTQEHAPGNG